MRGCSDLLDRDADLAITAYDDHGAAAVTIIHGTNDAVGWGRAPG